MSARAWGFESPSRHQLAAAGIALPAFQLRMAARVLGRADGLKIPGSDGGEVDLELHARGLEAVAQVLVVAERLAVGQPAPAQGRARQLLDRAVVAAHLDRPHDRSEERRV